MCFLQENKLNVAIITLQECSQCTLVKHPLSPGSAPLSQRLTQRWLCSLPLSPFSFSLSLDFSFLCLLLTLICFALSQFYFSSQPLSQCSCFPLLLSLFFMDSGFFPIPSPTFILFGRSYFWTAVSFCSCCVIACFL